MNIVIVLKGLWFLFLFLLQIVGTVIGAIFIWPWLSAKKNNDVIWFAWRPVFADDGNNDLDVYHEPWGKLYWLVNLRYATISKRSSRGYHDAKIYWRPEK